MSGVLIPPARLRLPDTLRVAATGLTIRPVRAVLSALGIAIGVAAMVAVVGISASSQEQVNQQLRTLGTNLLTLTPGTTFTSQAELPAESVDMVARMAEVQTVSAVGTVSGAAVYRNEHIDPNQTNALAVSAARTDLLDTVGGTVRSGRWLDDALASYPWWCSAPPRPS